MAIRIVGVDLPQNKRGEIALTYIYGIGRSSSAKILDKAGVSRDLKVCDWTDDQAAKIREIIGAEFKVEGDLRSEIQMNIKRLMDIGCYRGIRPRNEFLKHMKQCCLDIDSTRLITGNRVEAADDADGAVHPAAVEVILDEDDLCARFQYQFLRGDPYDT